MLLNRKTNQADKTVGDHASHYTYNKAVEAALLNIITTSKGDNQDAYDEIVAFVATLKIKLENEVVKGDEIVNTIIVQ